MTLHKPLLFFAAAAAAIPVFARAQPATRRAPDRSILGKRAILARYDWRDNLDDAWFARNIPFFESPDARINATYYYRWELVTKHLVYGSPTSGYTFSEFIVPVPWAGAYGAISCPMGLQMEEVRWLKNRKIVTDFTNYWFDTPGAQPRSYSNWYGDAVWQTYCVTGDRAELLSRLPSMIQQYQGWIDEHYDAQHQMFHWSGMHDGMEFTIASRQTQDAFAGADSYRPTLNSYVYGDLIAIAKTLQLDGKPDQAAGYQKKADAIKRRVTDQLWDPGRKFFIGQFKNDEHKDGHTVKAKTLIYADGQFAGDPHGRELSGYAPWKFNLPDPGAGYEAAWAGITDPQVFLAPNGLYFTQRNDPMFLMAQSGCVWSGNNWPYADSIVLAAMANVIDNYPQQTIDKEDYFKVFQAYTAGQVKDGRPYVAEMSDPDTGKWVQDEVQHSEHYFHSSYNDLLITGLVGLRPRSDDTVELKPLIPDAWAYFCLDDVAYHGHHLSVVWDRDGKRYGQGEGLTLIVDGTPIANRRDLGPLEAKLPPNRPANPPDPALPADERNFAVNNDGSYYPRVRASSTAQRTSIGHVSNGLYYYHADRPLDRWESAPDADAQKPAGQTIEIDFGIERPVDFVLLYLLDDANANSVKSPVRLPAKVVLETWTDGRWTTAATADTDTAAPAANQSAHADAATPDTNANANAADTASNENAHATTDADTRNAHADTDNAHADADADGPKADPSHDANDTANANANANANAAAGDGTRAGAGAGAGAGEGTVIPTHAPLRLAAKATRRLRIRLTPQPGMTVGLTEIQAWGRAALPLPQPDPSAQKNLAAGARASASFTSRFDKVGEINDGVIVMNAGRNRWTAFESPNATDWVQLDFKAPAHIGRVELCLWADGGGVKKPKDYAISYWDNGAWHAVTEARREPASPTLQTPNEVTIDPVTSTRLRVSFTHADDAKSGLTELIIRPPASKEAP